MGRGRLPARAAPRGFVLALVLVVAGCGRSGFVGMTGSSDEDPSPDETGTLADGGWLGRPGVDASPERDGAPPPAMPTSTSMPPVPTSTAEPVPTGTTTSPPPPPPAPTCLPALETCNGVDDDCNGQVDDDIAPIPCPDGGERYCVDGRYSACPDRCDVCIPGSERVCFLSYCTFWAKQICTADGRSFGVCREDPVPRECKRIAERYEDSKELEQCCIDNGYCCRDEFDLDGDGSRNDMVGSCDEVACTQ